MARKSVYRFPDGAMWYFGEDKQWHHIVNDADLHNLNELRVVDENDVRPLAVKGSEHNDALFDSYPKAQ